MTCETCEVLKQQVQFQQEQLRDLQAKLIEVSSPGANARIAAAKFYGQTVKIPATAKPASSHSPATLAASRVEYADGFFDEARDIGAAAAKLALAPAPTMKEQAEVLRQAINEEPA